ncbi:MAG: DUF2945 domain-containing protein [Pseudomonadota bacterium]
MAKKLKAGDAVSWKSHGGTAHGKVIEEVKERTQIKGHTVAASPENPQLIVETKKGARAAHKPDALTKE